MEFLWIAGDVDVVKREREDWIFLWVLGEADMIEREKGGREGKVELMGREEREREREYWSFCGFRVREYWNFCGFQV